MLFQLFLLQAVTVGHLMCRPGLSVSLQNYLWTSIMLEEPEKKVLCLSNRFCLVVEYSRWSLEWRNEI